MREIARELGVSRNTMRRYLRDEEAVRYKARPQRVAKLDPFRGYAVAHGRAAVCHEFLYVRDGRRDENRLAAIRHARAAIALGPDDAAALTYGGIAIGMVEHDRALAQEAFEAALAISPSASWAYLGDP